MTGRVVVAGQLARDLVLRVERMPAAGAAADVALRREMLGGKGANQAVSLAQLGATVSLIAVAGGDDIGDRLVARAARDGIDVSGVARRDGEPTGLIVEALDASGGWRYLQHLPPATLLTPADIEKADALFDDAAAVLVQLQQPPRAALAAARRGRRADALVVLDGVPAEEDRAELLAVSDVLRADEQETHLLTGVPPDDEEQVRAAAEKVLNAGPGLLALGMTGGNLFVWREGHLFLPLGDAPVVDTTGAGDALTAALTVALLRGDPPPDAARFAVAAAALTVGHPGGRPNLRRLRTKP
ncbi:PfkB family carbohydrate kinase [Paractinoplanes rhizophilus]|uniref:PfkB family carbohydrate kinase n=1 Tax=Paractinoplanes rhizophilus TaxID=1416877 RepID=A0ABW2HN42_9ACTN